jgi:hypothetical protein
VKRVAAGGNDLASGEVVELEILAGRLLAFCIHPCAAWPGLSRRERALVAGAYGAGSYVVILTLLLFSS